jgi:hypothetical protein
MPSPLTAQPDNDWESWVEQLEEQVTGCAIIIDAQDLNRSLLQPLSRERPGLPPAGG